MNNIYLVLILICCAQFSYAQSILKGTLTDDVTKEPLISATVSVKGTTNGTVTDFDGNYSLNLEQGTHVIVFTYVGYQTIEQEVTADGSSPIDLSMNIKEAAIDGQVIIFTEGKYAKKLEESTASVEVISKEMIQNNNVTSLDDVVQKASGVQIMDGQVSIRGGAGYAYGAGSRVSFLVDGQSLLSAELSDVKWNFVPIENAEQVEIIKGSASVLYGSGALNGVINVRTAYPTKDKPYSSFSLYSGVYSQPKVDSARWFDPKDNAASQPMFMGAFFAHRQMFGDNFDLVMGGNFHIENGFIKRIDERRFRFNFNTRYRLPKTEGKVSVGLNGNLMYHEIGTFFLAPDMKENAYTNLTSGGRDRYSTVTLDPYVTAYDKWENKHDIRGRWFQISKQRGGPNSTGNIFSLEYQFHREFKKGWKLIAGNLTQNYTANSILFNDNSGDAERAKFSGGSTALYAQVDKKFFDRLSMTLGTRWEGFFLENTFTPALPIFRVGANYTASKNDFIRASFGQGFRFPSLAERFINENLPLDGPVSIGIYPNPDVQPETGWSSEIAYRHTLNVNKFRLYADMAFFWMEYDNMVEFALDNYPEGLGFKTINVSEARIAGWELSMQSEGKIGNTPLRIWGGYTYSFPGDLSSDTTQRNIGVYLGNVFKTFAQGIDSEDKAQMNTLLKYRSLHTIRFDVETEVKNFTIGAVANYNSFIHKIDDVIPIVVNGLETFRQKHSNGNLVLDFRFGYKFNKKQRVNLIINNLLNTEYASRPGRMGSPRTVSVKYSHVF